MTRQIPPTKSIQIEITSHQIFLPHDKIQTPPESRIRSFPYKIPHIRKKIDILVDGNSSQCLESDFWSFHSSISIQK